MHDIQCKLKVSYHHSSFLPPSFHTDSDISLFQEKIAESSKLKDDLKELQEAHDTVREENQTSLNQANIQVCLDSSLI